MKDYRLFDIQRCSFVDGPGIRTTVFFRGCNLECRWCHNPESRDGKKHLLHYENLCTGCHKCDTVCPEGAISQGKVDYSKCTFCKECEHYCPTEAIKVCGEDYTVEEIFDIIKKDKPFYESSGGGVTFSGGECMLNADALFEILKRCQENGIHTCIDTAGCVPYENFLKVLPYTDLFLYDIKMLDEAKHREYTGKSNALILENLKKLFEAGADVWIRIPVISGVNDTREEMERIKEFLSPYQPKKIELLPYHKMGEGKYKALGIPATQFEAPDEQTMQSLKEVFEIK